MQGQMARPIMTASGHHLLHERGFEVASPSESGKLQLLHTTSGLVLVGLVHHSANRRANGGSNRTRHNEAGGCARGRPLLHIRAAGRQRGGEGEHAQRQDFAIRHGIDLVW